MVFARALCGVGSCVCDLGYPCSCSPGALGVLAAGVPWPARCHEKHVSWHLRGLA